MEEADWDAVIAVHLQGPLLLHAAVRALHQGHQPPRLPDHQLLVGVGAVRQLRPVELRRGQGRHRGLQPRASRKELAKYRCTVNTISPGAATRMTIPLARGARREGRRRATAKRGPQQIAPVVTWLASEAAKDVHRADRPRVARRGRDHAAAGDHPLVQGRARCGASTQLDDADAEAARGQARERRARPRRRRRQPEPTHDSAPRRSNRAARARAASTRRDRTA